MEYKNIYIYIFFISLKSIDELRDYQRAYLKEAARSINQLRGSVTYRSIEQSIEGTCETRMTCLRNKNCYLYLDFVGFSFDVYHSIKGIRKDTGLEEMTCGIYISVVKIII